MITDAVIDNLAYYDACLSAADVAALGIPEVTVEEMFAILSGEGALSAQANTVYQQIALLSGSGTLSATRRIAYQRVAAMLANGSLSAETFIMYATAMGLSGAGAFAALAWELDQASITTGGDGTVSATVMARYPMTVPFSGGGILGSPEFFDATYPDGLSARVARSYGAFLSGSGALTALMRMYQIQSAAALTGGGALAATTTVVQRDLRSAALGGDGTLSATISVNAMSYPALSGDGTLSATVYPVFNASTTLIDTIAYPNAVNLENTQWLRRNGAIGVTGSRLYPVQAGTWNEASWVKMSGNDAEVTVTLGPFVGTPANGDYTTILIGMGESGDGIFAFFNGGNGVTIYTQSAWDTTGLASQTTAPFGALNTGDKLTVRREGNVYSAYLNGVVLSAATFTDTAPVVPINQAHRTVGVADYTGGADYRTIETVEARDLTPPTAKLSGGSMLSATALGWIPFSEANTNRTNQPVPALATEYRVNLVGAGGGGGGGANATSFGQGSGGCGGGGAARVSQASWRPKSELGATYSMTRGLGGNGGATSSSTGSTGAPGTAGGNSVFSSGSITLTAGGGTGGPGGINSSTRPAASVAGTASQSGTAAYTLLNGTVGGRGLYNGTSEAGADNANGAGAGGGSGSGLNITTTYNPAKGGNSATVTAPAAPTSSQTAGSAPANATAPNGGAGGSGGKSNTNGVTSVSGGAGGLYGGGGGGAGQGNAGGQTGVGGKGGDGYTLIEFR